VSSVHHRTSIDQNLAIAGMTSDHIDNNNPDDFCV
jgi:hypothetical protein